MLSLSEAEQKLNFADYLLNRDPPFVEAAIKHISQVMNILLIIYFKLNESTKISPQIALQKLSNNAETKEFAQYYFTLFEAPHPISKQEAENAYKAAKSFLKLVKRACGQA
jgi:hypothetical protein